MVEILDEGLYELHFLPQCPWNRFSVQKYTIDELLGIELDRSSDEFFIKKLNPAISSFKNLRMRSTENRCAHAQIVNLLGRFA